MGSSSNPGGFAPPDPPSPSLAGAPTPRSADRRAANRARPPAGATRPAAAFRDGLRRVNGAPVLVCGMFAVTLLVSLPLSTALGGMIAGTPRTQPGCRRRCGRCRLRLVAGVLGAGDRSGENVRTHDRRLRRGARQPRESAGQPPTRCHDRRGHLCVAGDLVVPVGRRHRSARARAADPELTAFSPPAGRISGGCCGWAWSRSWCTTCCSRAFMHGCSTPCIRV